jgi:hypothetical protein
MGKVLIVIIIILVLAAGLYVYHLGASGKLTFTSLFPNSSSSSSSPFSLIPLFRSTETGPQGPAGPSGGGGTYIGPTQSGGSGSAAGTASAPSITIDPSTIPASEIPTGFTAAQLSPYFREVQFAGVSAGNAVAYGTIGLHAQFTHYNATGTIDITGWHIETRGSGEYIPQAIDVYDPSGLTPPSDIRLANGDTAYLYSSSAPFNLRLNECIGWIAHEANFKPALPQSCAKPDESQVSAFTGGCQEYVETLSGCSQPKLPNALVPQTDYACQDFLNDNFTYKSCFDEHDSDPNFLSNQVWVWMGGNVIGQYHDTVDLFDRNGLLVNQYSF